MARGGPPLAALCALVALVSACGAPDCLSVVAVADAWHYSVDRALHAAGPRGAVVCVGLDPSRCVQWRGRPGLRAAPVVALRTDAANPYVSVWGYFAAGRPRQGAVDCLAIKRAAAHMEVHHLRVDSGEAGALEVSILPRHAHWTLPSRVRASRGPRRWACPGPALRLRVAPEPRAVREAPWCGEGADRSGLCRPATSVQYLAWLRALGEAGMLTRNASEACGELPPFDPTPLTPLARGARLSELGEIHAAVKLLPCARDAASGGNRSGALPCVLLDMTDSRASVHSPLQRAGLPVAVVKAGADGYHRDEITPPHGIAATLPPMVAATSPQSPAHAPARTTRLTFAVRGVHALRSGRSACHPPIALPAPFFFLSRWLPPQGMAWPETLGKPVWDVRAALLELHRPPAVVARNASFGAGSRPAVRDPVRYVDEMRRARFCAVPRGAGLSSYRLAEAALCGCVPVVLSDGWVMPLEADDSGAARSITGRCDARAPGALRPPCAAGRAVVGPYYVRVRERDARALVSILEAIPEAVVAALQRGVRQWARATLRSPWTAAVRGLFQAGAGAQERGE